MTNKTRKTFLGIALAVLILSCSVLVVFAVSDGINNQDAAMENTVTPQPEEAPITFKSLDEYEVKPQAKPGSKAEKMLLDVLSRKNMTEMEIRDYNATPDDIKELTYEQAREQERYYRKLFDEAKEPANWDELVKDVDNFRKSEKYRLYADAIAVEQDRVEVLRDELLRRATCMRFDRKFYFLDDPEFVETALPEDVRREINAVAWCDFVIKVTEDWVVARDVAEANKQVEQLRRIDYLFGYYNNYGAINYYITDTSYFPGLLEKYNSGVPLDDIIFW